MSNVDYHFKHGVGYGRLSDGTEFQFDADRYDRISHFRWYACRNRVTGSVYIENLEGKTLHRYLVDCPPGYEIDHINLNTLDNRCSNLRICTHQQNQCNQPLQKNNSSGVSGVSYFAPRKKYRARIKVCQHEVHLGYYTSFEEAVQARNVGMECMFGEYGRYNDVADAPSWIRQKVVAQCNRFAALSICSAFAESVRSA